MDKPFGRTMIQGCYAMVLWYIPSMATIFIYYGLLRYIIEYHGITTVISGTCPKKHGIIMVIVV